jgi:hypothetical protein
MIRTFMHYPLATWIPVRTGAWISSFTMAINAGLFLVAALAVMRKNRSGRTILPLDCGFALFLCLMLFVFPISWIHYYIFLIPAYILFIPRFLGDLNNRKYGIPIMLSLSYFLTALIRVKPNAYYRSIEHSLLMRIWCSHYFFGAVLLFVICIILVRREHSIPYNRTATLPDESYQ